MRKLVFILAIVVVATTAFFSCVDSTKVNKDLPRVAIAGLAIESSTFSPAVTYETNFAWSCHARGYC